MKKKVCLSVAAIALVLCCAIGGTLAWLSTRTGTVENTFTVGDINIDLTETTKNYKMVPGNKINKDPKVTVKAGSEACWLFVKVEKSDNFDDFMNCETADGWTELAGETGVYYRKVSATAADTDFAVLKDNKVTVKETVTKQMLKVLTDNTYPRLTFTAYAVQQDNITDVTKAWEAAKTAQD